jgi:hypothetical protein
MKLKNVSPMGALIVPFTGQTVEFGGVFEIADDLAAQLLASPIYEEVTDAPAATPVVDAPAPAATEVAPTNEGVVA